MSVRSILFLAYFIILSAAVAQAQTGFQPATLEPRKPAERTIAGGESHTYQITLAAGQFVRVVVEQRGMDVKLWLAGSDSKPLIESDMTGTVGASDSLAYEAAAAGNYQIVVRANGAATRSGAYVAKLEVKSSASAQDRKRITAESLLNDARRLYIEGRYADPKLSETLGQALATFRELEDRYLQGLTLNLMGLTHSGSDQYEKAIEAYEQALSLIRGSKLRAGEAELLANMANASNMLDSYDKAFEYYEQTLLINRELKDRLAEGNTLNKLGVTLSNMDRYQKAIEYHEQALAVYRELKSRLAEASALRYLGSANASLGNLEDAIGHYEQALAATREVKDRAVESTMLSLLSETYRQLQRYDKAVDYAQQALELARAEKNRAGERAALYYLGSAYEYWEKYEKAIEYLEQALAIAREMKVREHFALINLGNAYSRGGQLDKAAELYRQALTIAREKKLREFEQTPLANLANIESKRGNWEKAIEYTNQSQVIARETKRRDMEAHHFYNLGGYYYKMGRLDKAIESWRMDLAIQRELRDAQRTMVSLHVLAWAELKRDAAAARVYIEESLKINETLRRSLMTPQSRAQHSASGVYSYKLYSGILMRQHQAEPTKGFDAAAFESSEFQRARSLLDLLAEAGTDIRQGVNPELLEREREIGEQLSDKAQQLTRVKPEQVDPLNKEIGQLETELERAQAAIRKASPHYAALTQPQPVKLSEIQAQLDDDTVLLEYSLGTPGEDQIPSYLWAITRDKLTTYELPKVENIEKIARDVYELLTARSTNKKGETEPQRQERISQAEAKLPAAALELSKTILAPVAAQLGSKRLIVVADGALQYIPFAMLPDPAYGNNQPLVVGHEIVSLPSASTLVFQRKELAGRLPAPKTLAVIADPVFDRTDVRFKVPVSAPDDKAPAAKSADTRGLEHIVDESATPGRLVIRRLPFTRKEADALLQLTPKNSSFKAIDFQANRTNVLNGDLFQYKYVHFATHGVMDAQRPGLSSLVLSTVDADGKPQNGFLRANDIYNMKLPAELVVLSACQTGLGKEVKGEGLIGLTRGFMYAGAKRVVVSLWSVNDKATSDLMTKFYRGMLKDNERPAAALRAAQIEMWKQKKWQSPYYWAAFTMQGEWR